MFGAEVGAQGGGTTKLAEVVGIHESVVLLLIRSRFFSRYLAMIGIPSSVGSLSNISQRLLQTISFRGLRVQCLRVGNTEIPNDKKLEISLQHVYGIGRSRAHQILCDLSIGNKLTKDLTGVELNTLREEVSRYMTGEDLRRCIKHDIGRLVDIQCYRGIRHSVGLPCRGQRTSTNARTQLSRSLGFVLISSNWRLGVH
ncbi:hypothetical protein LWI28_009700 [Acer negundo]|uniref:Ribosomal protein S13 n=1 Tax=Acer negundo TaxID=4023 RepID=A0AAD5NHH4_ACENE|nr:hypothetical protein LWI28_009700 [Acer negundo]